METGQHLQFPANVKVTARGLHICFATIPPCAFIEPFAHETLTNNFHSARNEVFYPWKTLFAYLDNEVGARPLGIIMHPARVGSTLQIACLRCSRHLTSYSEPPVINDLLYWLLITDKNILHPLEIVAALRFIVDLIGKHASRPFVLKLRSWNSLFASLISNAFPETPWVFSVRNPIEIGVSIERKPPTWMRAFNEPNNPFLPYATTHGEPNTRENYFAGMFASFCDSVGEIRTHLGSLVRYEQLPNAVWELVCPHFGISLGPAEINSMKSIARYDVKRGNVFIPDISPKQADASAALRDSVFRIAAPALARLEETFASNTTTTTNHDKHNHLANQIGPSKATD